MSWLLLLVLAQAGADKVAPVVPDRFSPAQPEGQRLWGLLGDRMKVNVEQRLMKVDEEGILAGFEKRPGKQAWIGEHAGKFLDAAAHSYRYRKDQKLKLLMDRVAKRLLTTQLTDGYLGTYLEKDRWTSWDVWVHKYDLLGLLSYWRVTGDERALGGAKRIGDLLVNTFGPGKRDIIASSTHVGMAATSVLEPMVLLHRATGDARYLEFARHLVASWEQQNGPKLISSLLSHGRVDRTANGKAYEMMSDLVGALELYRSTGDEKLFRAAVAAWRDIAANRLYLTGTTSSHEHFHADGDLLGEESCDVGEGCATVTWLQLNWQLLRLTGDPQYAAQIEKTVFNQLLAAQDPKNGNICYFTPLNGKKNAGPGISCCVSSEPRGIALIPQLAWGGFGGGVAVQLYGPGSFTVGSWVWNVETSFPESGTVKLTLTEGNGEFPLWLRVPEWTTGFTAAAGGRKVAGRAGDYLMLERKWTRGDTVEIEMAMTERWIDGGPQAYPGFAALQRGPQVFALEKSLNEGVELHRAGLAGKYEVREGRAGARLITGLAMAGGRWVERDLTLVPFSEATEYRIWLPQADRLRAMTAVSALAFGRETLTPRRTADHGSIADERLDTWRRGAGFAVEVSTPRTVSRIVFKHGRVFDDGGWFAERPKVEIKRSAAAEWETVGELAAYPVTAGDAAPALADGQAFELRLPTAVELVGVRVSGKPARQSASCAELAAY